MEKIKKSCANCGDEICRRTPFSQAAAIWGECRIDESYKHWCPLITEIHIEAAKTCIGLDYRKPYKRNGKMYYRPNQNCYSTYSDDRVWGDLELYGYAKHNIPEKIKDICKYCDYSLNREGLDWLGKLLGIKIYNEEG